MCAPHAQCVGNFSELRDLPAKLFGIKAEKRDRSVSYIRYGHTWSSSK